MEDFWSRVVHCEHHRSQCRVSCGLIEHENHVSSVFLVVGPSKTIRLYSFYKTLYTTPQKEDIILLFIGYHNTPKSNNTHVLKAQQVYLRWTMGTALTLLLHALYDVVFFPASSP